MKGHLIAAAMIAVALSGCATGYHDARNPILGFAGGYWDAPGPGRLIIVGFSANSFSRNEMVENFLLYRCAEVAKREGATHFVLYPTLPDAVADKRSSGRTVKSTFGKPATHAYILPVAAGEPSALSSAELIARLGPLVKPGKAQEKSS